MAKQKGIIVVEADKFKLDSMSETKNHQGVIAIVPPFNYYNIEDILEYAKSKNEEPFIVMLDGIEDPHNLGSIIRTAEGAGVHGIIIPKRRSVGITSAVVRASAGAAGHLPVARVANIAQTIDALKKQNIWVVGTDISGELIYDASLTGSLALVIGNENEGISRLVREKCDFLVRIPMMGAMSSLNASVAAGVAMYEVLRRKI